MAIVSLPDTGPRLFSLSRTHGPSALDAAGAALVLAGWIALDVAILRRRRRLGGRAWAAIAAGLIAGTALLVPAIANDWSIWWLPVALLAGVQIAAAVAARRGSPPPERP